MRTLPLRDAKASLSAVVEAAERGEATTITKHGRPAAVVVPVGLAKRLCLTNRPSFASLLMGIPYPVEIEPIPHRCERPICNGLATRYQHSQRTRPWQAGPPAQSGWVVQRPH